MQGITINRLQIDFLPATSASDKTGSEVVTERIVSANGIEIWCEDFGNPADPAVLLIMGAGGQAILWPDDFCAELSKRGRHVIRFDNRDIGQSTCVNFEQHPYTLSDLACDAVGVLDAYGIGRAHVVGASMGGMIAQTVAIEHPGRVRTLVSIMSTPLGQGFMRLMSGETGPLPPPSKQVLDALATYKSLPQNTPEERIEATVSIARQNATGHDPFDEVAVRILEQRMCARTRNPDAAMNHFLAVAASKDRTDELSRIAAPTLVIHGTADPTVLPEHGRATAAGIPGSRLLIIEGMAHAIPVFARGRLVDAIVEHTA